MNPKGYDPHCEDLAEGFLEDPPQHSRLIKAGYTLAELDELRRDLARTIQSAVEDFFAVLDDEIEAREQAQTGQQAAHDDGEGHT